MMINPKNNNYRISNASWKHLLLPQNIYIYHSYCPLMTENLQHLSARAAGPLKTRPSLEAWNVTV